MQRQKRVLYQRLRVPPAVNQFTKTLQNNQSKNLWRLLAKYTPEAKKDKVARLRNAAQNKADGKEADTKKPVFLKFGLNHVTSLVESGEAKLVVIAHDVDPIELEKLCTLGRNEFLESGAAHNTYGAPVMGIKARHREERIERLKQAEVMRKN